MLDCPSACYEDRTLTGTKSYLTALYTLGKNPLNADLNWGKSQVYHTGEAPQQSDTQDCPWPMGRKKKKWRRISYSSLHRRMLFL